MIERWDWDDDRADLEREYQDYIATIDRWSAQDRPYDLGIDQDDEYRNIVDAIDTMLYYEAHPEEADQERVLAGTQQSEPARELDDVWDWEP